MDLREESIGHLDELAAIPTTFLVERALNVSVVDGGLGGIVLSEVLVEEPWIKDYDAIKGEGPSRWAERFDVTNWGLIAAHDSERPSGAAVVAFDTAGVNMLQGRLDLAVLWDIRVRPEVRSAGTGARLFSAAEAWARDRGCRTPKVETSRG